MTRRGPALERGSRGVDLGSRILRVETAAVMLAALLSVPAGRHTE